MTTQIKTIPLECQLTVMQSKVQKLVTIPKNCNINAGDKIIVSKVIEE